MKKILFVFSCSLFFLTSPAQDIPQNLQQQLEDHAERSGEKPEEESWIQQLEMYSRHKLNLNKVVEQDLRNLGILNEIQLRSFFSYRKLMGEFLSLYELQAIPGWDPPLIQKLFPYITVSTVISNKEQLFSRLKKGQYAVLLRSSMELKRSAGYRADSLGRNYSGSPQHLFFRLRYQYKDLLQWGISGEKDAGEPFLRGKGAKGFDHYSFHFLIRRMGMLRALALGDFTVNLGQGLIQWQRMAFKRSAEVMNCKRQSEPILPYSSSGEFYYHRGAAITLAQGPWAITGFISFRRLDANRYQDTLEGSWYLRSLQTTGYHRTRSEIEDRAVLGQFSYGGNVSYERNGWKAGINMVHYHFSLPFRKLEEANDRYAVEGDRWSNGSTDLSYTWKNLHWFSEMALDARARIAVLSGLLLSLDKKADLSLLWRNIGAGYQTINGNAFTESTLPSNEKGLYLGLSLRPHPFLRLDAYTDIYKFPWLRYRVHAPSAGHEYLLQGTYTPDKRTELYARVRLRRRQMNQEEGNYYAILPERKMNFRLHLSRKISSDISIRQRIEYMEVGKDLHGFSFLFDVLYRPALKPFSFSARWQYFETDGDDAAVYAYEQDVLYSFSIPGLSGKGKRYYALAGFDLDKKTSCWLRVALTSYAGQDHIGENNDLIEGHARADYHFQLRRIF